jgi:cytochrome c-type biogenesis protein CcmF
MAPGERVAIGGYEFTFKGTREVPGPNFTAILGDFDVRREGESRVARTMHPEKRTYHASGQTMTEADIDTGLTRDLYVSLGEPVGDGAWGVRVYHKPFVDWIWGGCFIMALGGFVAMADRRYRAGRRAAAAAGGLQGARA